MICAKILFLLKFLDSITRSDVCKSLLIGMLLAGPSLGAEPGVTDRRSALACLPPSAGRRRI
jgi:hypothetical protein